MGPSGGDGEGAQNDMPWWMKYAGKGAGIGGGVGKDISVDSSNYYLIAILDCSGHLLWVLVLHLLFSAVYCCRNLADLRWPLCHHSRGSILLHVFGLCSASSGQS